MILVLILGVLFSQIDDSLVLALEKQEYHNLINFSPKNKYEQLIYALALAKNNKLHKAKQVFSQITVPYPKGYYYIRGVLFEKEQNFIKAEQSFKESIKRQEYISKSKIELGKIKRLQGDYEGAIKEWGDILNTGNLTFEEENEVHFLIAESLYMKYRYVDTKDTNILKDAKEHLKKVKLATYLPNAKKLEEQIDLLENLQILPEDSKDLEANFKLELGSVSSPEFNLVGWQTNTYWTDHASYLYNTVDISSYYAPFRLNNGKFRWFFGLEGKNTFFTKLDAVQNLDFTSIALGTKLNYLFYNETLSLNLKYSFGVDFADITQPQYLYNRQLVDLNIEYLLKEHFYFYLGMPVELVNDSYKLPIKFASYYINKYLNTGFSVYYASIGGNVQDSVYGVDTVLALGFVKYQFGAKYLLEEYQSMSRNSIDGLFNYYISGTTKLGLFVRNTTNSTLGISSMLFGLKLELRY